MFFVISLILVVGIKSLYYTIRPNSYKKQPSEPEKTTQIKRRTAKPVRTIEIDPDLADRIYFKKSS